MANKLHSALTGTDGIHIIHQYTYANTAARTGASGFSSTDIGKVAYQTDNATFWVLTATTPTWKAIAVGGSTLRETPTGTVNGTNKTFTVTQTPFYVISDGNHLIENNGYTRSGTTLTLSVAPVEFIRSYYQQ